MLALTMYVCVFFPFFVVSSSPIATQSQISTGRSSQDGAMPMTSIHLVGFDCIYKETAACHSAKSTDIATIMVNICYS